MCGVADASYYALSSVDLIPCRLGSALLLDERDISHAFPPSVVVSLDLSPPAVEAKRNLMNTGRLKNQR